MMKTGVPMKNKNNSLKRFTMNRFITETSTVQCKFPMYN